MFLGTALSFWLIISLASHSHVCPLMHLVLFRVCSQLVVLLNDRMYKWTLSNRLIVFTTRDTNHFITDILFFHLEVLSSMQGKKLLLFSLTEYNLLLGQQETYLLGNKPMLFILFYVVANYLMKNYFFSIMIY